MTPDPNGVFSPPDWDFPSPDWEFLSMLGSSLGLAVGIIGTLVYLAGIVALLQGFGSAYPEYGWRALPLILRHGTPRDVTFFFGARLVLLFWPIACAVVGLMAWLLSVRLGPDDPVTKHWESAEATRMAARHEAEASRGALSVSQSEER